MVERKKKHPAKAAPAAEAPPAPAPAQSTGARSVGQTLRAAREASRKDLEEVSQELRIRASQLRAIEEGDIASLPGMTYAIGFLRSYANHLGLNGAEMVKRFKDEHSQDANLEKADLSFPAPEIQSRVPDPMMIGAGAFFAVLILIGWTVYSNGRHAQVTETPVPAAPAIEQSAEAPVTEPQPDAAALAPAPAAPAPEAAAAVPAPAPETPAPAEAAAAAPAAPEAAVAQPEQRPAEAKPEETKPAEETAEKKPEEKKAEEKKAEAEPIVIKKGKSRITFKANQDSWIQILDENEKTVYKKVLRQGEEYAVPDQPGLTFDTNNAGGLSVTVDGKEVSALGASGDVLSGWALSPERLKARRGRINN